ncbi:QWRF motif-containing protein 2-like [Andrographis paniculata]|uniref:QWRF motif-containing protein 2-like n=1 Tax=Andrographis paniculata TaxID=175694 RepID=UPI0021E958BB|nr:QWRF motif-containing protein 2-like [Andrographis paniculata]
MVTAVASTHRLSENTKLKPFLPSDAGNGPPVRRPKSREVTSRYLSAATTSSSSNSSSSTNTTSSSVTSGFSTFSRRPRSPITSTKTVVATTPKSQQRAVSAERRRAPATPSSAERMLVTSMRSLSVSFQGDSYSVPVSKVKAPPTTVGTSVGPRKGTAEERRKAGVTPGRDRKEKDWENSRPSNQQQHRWPGRLRSENSSVLTRSLDCSAERVQSVRSYSGIKELRKSMADERSNDAEGRGLRLELDCRSKSGDSINSDVKSVSLESTASRNSIQLKGRPHGLVVPARIWQDPSNKAQELQYLDSPSPKSAATNRSVAPSKLLAAKKVQNNSLLSWPKEASTSRGSSPHRGVVRSASPGKAFTPSTGAIMRGMATPPRARNGSLPMNESNICRTPSMFHFSVDARKGKLGENYIAESHELRLLYNRLLQWRLANAKREHSLFFQKHMAQGSLYDAWMKNSKLQNLVASKRIELQLVRHKLKLHYILLKQEPHLECWGLIDTGHCNSVSSAVDALKASTVRLPIVCGAKADVHKVQLAISSAVDVMQAMASSICSLLSKVEQMNLLVSELSNTSVQGHRFLAECKDFLSVTFIPLQVMHCDLRTQVLQIQQEAMLLEQKRHMACC